MKSSSKIFFSLISTIVIVAASLIVAFVCFNILESSATATIKEWKLGGAFAAFILCSSTLTSIVFQFYKNITKDQTLEYQKQIEELNMKLIKGATCSDDCTIDIDEKHRLVFSRPKEWTPLNGFLYQYIEKKKDEFQANFNVIYRGLTELKELFDKLNLKKMSNNSDIKTIYDNMLSIDLNLLATLPNYKSIDITKEIILVDEYKSLKVLHSYEVELPKLTVLKCNLIYTYVEKYNALYQFTFTDDDNSFYSSSEIFNNTIGSIRFL